MKVPYLSLGTEGAQHRQVLVPCSLGLDPVHTHLQTARRVSHPKGWHTKQKRGVNCYALKEKSWPDHMWTTLNYGEKTVQSIKKYQIYVIQKKRIIKTYNWVKKGDSWKTVNLMWMPVSFKMHVYSNLKMYGSKNPFAAIKWSETEILCFLRIFYQYAENPISYGVTCLMWDSREMTVPPL